MQELLELKPEGRQSRRRQDKREIPEGAFFLTFPSVNQVEEGNNKLPSSLRIIPRERVCQNSLFSDLPLRKEFLLLLPHPLLRQFCF